MLSGFFRGFLVTLVGGHPQLPQTAVRALSSSLPAPNPRLLLLPKVLVLSGEWCLETTVKVLTVSGSDTSYYYTFSWVRLGSGFPLRQQNASGIHGDPYNLNLELLGFYAYVQFCIYILYLKCLKSPGLYCNHVSVIVSYKSSVVYVYI